MLTKRQAEILKDYFVMKLQSLVDDIEKQIDSLTAPENGVVDINIEDFSVNDTNEVFTPYTASRKACEL